MGGDLAALIKSLTEINCGNPFGQAVYFFVFHRHNTFHDLLLVTRQTKLKKIVKFSKFCVVVNHFDHVKKHTPFFCVRNSGCRIMIMQYTGDYTLPNSVS